MRNKLNVKSGKQRTEKRANWMKENTLVKNGTTLFSRISKPVSGEWYRDANIVVPRD